MENLFVNGLVYRYTEQFDVNLTLQYENDRWEVWHIVREFISNALDSVGGNISKVSIGEEDGYFNIADCGEGYPITFAKRIGASSKKQAESSIGQFGEGTKMAVLTCLRKGLSVRLASQNWLIVPKAIPIEEGLEVLVFDIFESEEAITGSLVSVEASEEIKHIVENTDQSFLQFSCVSPLHGTMTAGIYPIEGKAKVFNKGVFIKNIDAMYSYALSISQLNRDRDLLDDDTLCLAIRDLWNTVDKPELIECYFQESCRAASTNNNFKEFVYCLYPVSGVRSIWLEVFRRTFGSKAIIFTNELASRESRLLGYSPVQLDYYGRYLAESIGVPKDVDVVSDDYEITWAGSLNEKEEARLAFFKQIADVVSMDLPKTIRVFESYAQSDKIIGLYNSEKDEIYLKREQLGGNIAEILDIFIHELNHKATGADDMDRRFADGLSTLGAKLVLQLMKKVGMPIKLNLTNRGFKLPRNFSYCADKLSSHIATLGNQIIIHTNGRILTAYLNGSKLKPYCSERSVTFYKGDFYINIPISIREALPEEVSFNVTVNVEQI